MVPKSRQSRVSLSGDCSFFYEETNDPEEKGVRKSSLFTPQFIREKIIEIDKDLEDYSKI